MNIIEISIRIVCAIAIGGIIGYERERINRPAGLRTHILVCVGAAVISLIQMESIARINAMILAEPVLANTLKSDVGRMGAQVVTGVGFLGAGTIIKEKGVVKGLTTAASIWVVACIGLAVGMGFYKITAVTMISVILAIVLFKKIEREFIDKKYVLNMEVVYSGDQGFIKKLNDYFYLKKIEVNSVEYVAEKNLGDDEEIKVIYSLDVMKNIQSTRIVQDISAKYRVNKIAVLS